jgi:small subunit ribosomal protein S17
MNKVVRSLTGNVISTGRNKSVTVLVKRRVKHELFGKIITKFRKYHIHDENNQCKIGDQVTIVETKRISKTKSWTIQAN